MKHLFKSFIACTLFLCFFGMDAQQTVYTRSIAGVNADFIMPGENNSVYIFGEKSFGEPLLVMKINSAGSMLWSKTYVVETSTATGEGIFYDAVTNYDSSVTIVGQTSRTGRGLAFCLKLKPNGDVIWSKKLTDGIFDVFIPYRITSTNDSGSVITGGASSTNSPQKRLFVAKLGKNGTLNWLKTFSDLANYEGMGYGIKQTPDSGFIVVGSAQQPSFGRWTPLVCKLNKSGSIQWTKSLRYSDHLYGFDVVLDQNGFTFLSMSSRPFLIKYDYGGNHKWTACFNEYPQVYAGYFSGFRLRKTSQKGYLIVNKGVQYGPSWLLVADSLGAPVWSFYSFLLNIDAIQNQDRSFSCVGNREFKIVQAKGESSIFPDIDLFRTDSIGLLNSPCYFRTKSNYAAPITFTEFPVSYSATSGGVITSFQPTITISPDVTGLGCMPEPTGIDENAGEPKDLEAFPNPADSYFIIRSATEKRLALKLVLQDLSGRKVLEREIDENEEINCANVGTGMYLYLIYQNDVLLKSAKLVLGH